MEDDDNKEFSLQLDEDPMSGGQNEDDIVLGEEPANEMEEVHEAEPMNEAEPINDEPPSLDFVERMESLASTIMEPNPNTEEELIYEGDLEAEEPQPQTGDEAQLQTGDDAQVQTSEDPPPASEDHVKDDEIIVNLDSKDMSLDPVDSKAGSKPVDNKPAPKEIGSKETPSKGSSDQSCR